MCIFLFYLTSWLGIISDITLNILSLRRKKRKGHHLYKWHCSDLSIFKRVYYLLAPEFILCKQVCTSLCMYVLVYIHVYVCWQDHACLYFHKRYGCIFFHLVIFCLNISQTHHPIDSKGIYSEVSKKSDKDIERQHQTYLTTVLYNYFILYWRVRLRK